MDIQNLTLPEKGFTITERQYLELILAKLKTNQAVPGRNITITETDSGQVINADDCGPCP